MEKVIKRLIRRLFPELTGGFYLPQWGRVAAIPASIEGAATSTASSPHYCVDVQRVNSDGSDNDAIPIFKAIPLPATAAGSARGFFGFPQLGTLVELGIIHGLPHKPFIRAVLIEGLTVPEFDSEYVLRKQSESVFQRADKHGDWRRECPEKIHDQAKNYAAHIAEISRGLNHHIESGGAIWLGNSSDNVLSLLSQLMGIVQQLSTDLAGHTQKDVQAGNAQSGPPQNAAPFTGTASGTAAVKAKLDPIVE